jgi:CheY-like chemotaxis protein
MPKAVEKGIMLHFYAEPHIGRSPMGDPTRLRQVFVNLLSNAIKFTNMGMVKLHAQIKEKKENSIKIYFEIKDSGIGMTKQQIEKIFDPFTQAESGTTRKYGGTGLGLAITKNIVEMMGGKLNVESTPGVGSKFSFEIAFETVDISKEDYVDRKMLLHEIEKPAFDGEVLLCEDNVMNQQVICEHLARVGLKTIVADNGKIGVETVKERVKKGEKLFDLIFMDMHMPVMDGLEAAAEIEKLKTGMPIVAMTANIMANDTEIYKAHGMHDCVGKPFTSQELWRCLVKYIKPINNERTMKSDSIETDVEFQNKIKLIFAKNNQKKYEEIIEALDIGDIKLAHRLVHTLKSNAGQIGKKLLQSAALTVENQLKDEKNLVTSEQLSALKNELTAVLNELAPLLAELDKKPAEQPQKALDPALARELLEKIEPLVKSGNPKALDYKGDLQGIPGSDKLIQQIEDFEFEKALSTLTEIKKGWA